MQVVPKFLTTEEAEFTGLKIIYRISMQDSVNNF